MERFTTLLLDVWREACKHIEIGESVAKMAPILLRRVPVDLVLVRRFDLAKMCVDTVAAGACHDISLPENTRTECTPEQHDRLADWCRANAVIRRQAQPLYQELPGLLPAGLDGQVLAGPLNWDRQPAGVLILVSNPSHPFRPEHDEVVTALLEPFAVALDNDRRLHELTRLREAVEADNQSLLSRLGRQKIVDSIVGADSGLKEVMQRVDQVAQSDVPVLLLGETGSGKEVVARAIHNGSNRSAAPFHRVNCGAIPPELIDSELFGHERGSFTGAVSQRKGWFERALKGLAGLKSKLEGPRSRLSTYAGVAQGADRIIAEAGAGAWIRYTIDPWTQESFRQESRGRPGSATRWRRRTRSRFRLSWDADGEAINADARTDPP